jgi:aspartate racemase
MKHAGILAHSAEGASLCFLAFCQAGFTELGPHQHPDVTLDCIAMGHSMSAWERADYATVRRLLARSTRRLAGAGADFIACPDNTAHIAMERTGEEFALPALHIAEVVTDQAQRDGRRKVGILGTRFTMDGPVYPRALGARDIDYAVPDADDRELVDRIIFDELVNGTFTDAARAAYVEIIGKLRNDGCDTVALVCTEIPLLIGPDVSPLPTLDSTRLLARAAFDVAAGRRPMPSWRGGPIRGG